MFPRYQTVLRGCQTREKCVSPRQSAAAIGVKHQHPRHMPPPVDQKQTIKQHRAGDNLHSFLINKTAPGRNRRD